MEFNLLELQRLKEGKNLLAFSGGVDSTALLFILLRLGVRVDLALVNYKTRRESDLEEEYAKTLAKTLKINAFTVEAPKFNRSFEKMAREFRYNFFETLIDTHHYDNLLTAHHLGDRLEWLLMRLIRGAGAVELTGMESNSARKTLKGKGYALLRPLLNQTKDELLTFLEQNGHKYFIDSSNFDKNIERNSIREQFANPLIKNHSEGIKRSFEYLSRDRDYLNECFKMKFSLKELAIFQLKSHLCIDRAVDSYLKSQNILMSARERESLIRDGFTMVGREWVAQRLESLIFISPFRTTPIPKKIKERFRIAKIPPKIRPYIWEEGIFEEILEHNPFDDVEDYCRN